MKALVGIIAAIVVVGGGYFIFSGQDKIAEDGTTEKTESVTEESLDSSQDDEDFTGSITGLLKRGKSVTCTFEQVQEEANVSGTVYISKDQRMRGDFKMTSAGFGAFDMSMIRDGEYMYSWGGPLGETQGTKIKLTESGEPTTKSEKGADFDQDFTYSCKRWNVDNGKFELPKTVTFQDLSEQMGQIDATMKGVNAAQCAACDQLPAGSGRDQCKATLGCS